MFYYFWYKTLRGTGTDRNPDDKRPMEDNLVEYIISKSCLLSSRKW